MLGIPRKRRGDVVAPPSLDKSVSEKHIVNNNPAPFRTPRVFLIFGGDRMSKEQIREALKGKFREEISRLSTHIKQEYSAFIDNALETDSGSEEGLIEAMLQVVDSGSATSQANEVLHKAIAKIEKCGSQVEILRALLEHTAQFCQRAALFIQKEDTLFGWEARGFSGRFSDADIRNLQISLTKNTVFQSVSQTGTSYQGDGTEHSDNESFFAKISDVRPEKVAVFPLKTQKRIVAHLYCDSGVSGQIQADSIDAMVRVGCLAVELLTLRSGEAEGIPLDANPSASEPSAEPVASEMSPDDFQEDVVQKVTEERQSEPAQAEEELLYSLDDQIAQVDDSAHSDSMEGAKPGTVETSAAVEAARVEDRSALANELSEGQEEAKRFARLLLSEIKLYNEQEVALAQQDNKVYERLRQDIDRSWEMYSERVSDQVSDKQPLFYQELVAILAKGNELVLGNSPYRA